MIGEGTEECVSTRRIHRTRHKGREPDMVCGRTYIEYPNKKAPTQPSATSRIRRVPRPQARHQRRIMLVLVPSRPRGRISSAALEQARPASLAVRLSACGLVIRQDAAFARCMSCDP